MSSHLKRYTMPTTWPLEKKGYTYVAKPMPGPHNMKTSLPLVLFLRDLLHLTQTTRETKKILHAKKVLINHGAVHDHHLPVGLFDIISFPEIKEHYVVLLDEHGKLYPKKVSQEQSEHGLWAIRNKTIIKGNKVQLNFSNGSNLLVPKDTYVVGDSVVVHDNKIVKHFKMEKGAMIYLISGKYAGKIGKLEEIKIFKGFEKDRIVFKEGSHTFETLKEYAFVIEKPY